jgi:hypothetical protein
MKSKTGHRKKQTRAPKQRSRSRPAPPGNRLASTRIPLRWWLLVVLVLIWLCLPDSVQADVREILRLVRLDGSL